MQHADEHRPTAGEEVAGALGDRGQGVLAAERVLSPIRVRASGKAPPPIPASSMDSQAVCLGAASMHT